MSDDGGPEEGGPTGEDDGGSEEGGPTVEDDGGPEEGGPTGEVDGGPEEGGPFDESESGPEEDDAVGGDDIGSDNGVAAHGDDEVEVEVIIGGSDAESNGSGGSCEYGIRDHDTGKCPERPMLEQYEESNGGTGCDTSSKPIPNAPGVAVFATQRLQFVDNAVIANVYNVSAGISAINLVNAANAAEQSGDTSQVFQQAYNILFPLSRRALPLMMLFNCFQITFLAIH